MASISRLIALLTTAAIGVALHSAYTKQHLIIPHASLIHLLTTSLSTGLQLWTTFGFGILAFKALPRHMFGHLQSRLFPTYFAVVTVCTALQLLVLFTSTKLSTSSAQFQFKVLLVALGGAVLNIAVFEPATTSVMKQRHVFEKQHSSTQGGPSSTEMKQLKAKFPQYKALCSRFGAYHGASSLANLITLAACLTHVWYLSTRLSL